MVRWRQPDGEPDDDGWSAERAIWLRAPAGTPPEPSSHGHGDHSSDGVSGAAPTLPAPRPRAADHPPRHDEGPADADGETVRDSPRGAVHMSDSYDPAVGDTASLDPPGGSDRPSRRRRLVPILAIAAVLAVMGWVVYGKLGANPGSVATDGRTRPVPSLFSSQPLAPPASPTASTDMSSPPEVSAPAPAPDGLATTTPPSVENAPSSAPTTFAATAGAGCNNVDPTYNWYTNGQDGTWWTGAGGATECGGAALAMPASGNTSQDTDDYTVWWFATTPVVSGICAADVYVPNNTHASGQAAHYKILRGRTSSTVIASFTVDQTANRGRWVRLGIVSINGGGISIHLANRGPGGAFLGVAQARVSCAV